MRLTPRKKKILRSLVLILLLVTVAGCSVPKNADGTIKLIYTDTKFSEVMSDENWFSAIFVWPLAWLINHWSPTLGVGGAIACVTILVNGILTVATLKSTIDMQVMQTLQPELNKIQRKYEGRDDQNSQMKMAAEMQALYKKYNINPGSSMLVTFLQFPIIIAMYMAVQRSETVVDGTFLGMALDTTPLNGMKLISGGNAVGWAYLIMFVIMAACQFISMRLPQKMQKKRAEEEAAKHHRRVEANPQDTQQKLMQWYMFALIVVFGLMWPTAMALYWTINSLVTVAKSLITQKYVDKRQAEIKEKRAGKKA